MNSSSNNDQSSREEILRKMTLNLTQKTLNPYVESTESNELASTTNDPDIDNLVLPNDDSDVNDTNEVNKIPSPGLERTKNTFNSSFGSFEDGLSEICGSPTNIPSNNHSQPVPPFESSIDEQRSTTDTQNQSFITTDDNLLTTSSIERHIMISYNRDSSSDICENLRRRLENRGYKVWMDTVDLHGKVLNGMAKGVENSYIVLICYNEQYSESDFCEIEATYAFGRRIDLIPCRLQASYEPTGWLGSIVSTRNYIDFSPPNDFETTLGRLFIEIDHIKTHPQSNRNRSIDNNWNTQMYNQRINEQFNTLINQFKESINKSDQDLESLTKEELFQLVNYIREQLSNSTLLTNNDRDQRNQNNDQIIRNLFEQSRNTTELLRKIIEILSNPLDSKTIIKLAVTVLFVWTIKTHIIDAFMRHK